MKRTILYLGLSSLFLFGCSKVKLEKSEYLSIKESISNKEDFFFLITSKTCSHCENLKKSINKAKYNNVGYYISIDDILEGLKNKEEESIEAYKYFALMIDKAYSNVNSYAFNDTYQNMTSMSYTEMYGKDKHIEGYVNIVFPLTFFFIEGEISGFEVGDFSSSLDDVFNKYNEEL